VIVELSATTAGPASAVAAEMRAIARENMAAEDVSTSEASEGC